jgi:hypothetical protein
MLQLDAAPSHRHHKKLPSSTGRCDCHATLPGPPPTQAFLARPILACSAQLAAQCLVSTVLSLALSLLPIQTFVFVLVIVILVRAKPHTTLHAIQLNSTACFTSSPFPVVSSLINVNQAYPCNLEYLRSWTASQER